MLLRYINTCIISINLRKPYLFGIFKWVWVLELCFRLYIIFRENCTRISSKFFLCLISNVEYLGYCPLPLLLL